MQVRGIIGWKVVCGGICIAIVFFFFFRLLIVALAGSIITIGAFAFLGRIAGWASIALTVVALASAQTHWINGRTVCVGDSDHPYLWVLEQTGVETSSSSYSDDGETISFSFSTKSESKISGARFAKIIAGEDVKISRFQVINLENTVHSDVKIVETPPLPETLVGATFYVPRDAEFRSDLPFGSDPHSNAFRVNDLPVLVALSEDLYAPLGTLSGSISLASATVIAPAPYRGRNVVYSAYDKDDRSEVNRERIRLLESQATNIVAETFRKWTLNEPVSIIALNRYAELFDCRPQTYEDLGFGWLWLVTYWTVSTT